MINHYFPFLVSFIALPIHTNLVNNRPIIGILSQRIHPDERYPANATSYISAAYVKYLESAGARVVPILINTTEDELIKLLGNINGVLFPGGAVNLDKSAYARNARIVFDYALRENDAGKYYPVWGTCLGFEQILVLVGGPQIISGSIGTEDLSLPLNLTKDAEDSRLFAEMTDNIKHSLTNKAFTYNAHHNCVSVETYSENRALQNFFKVLSTNSDLSGKVFLSTIEGKHS